MRPSINFVIWCTGIGIWCEFITIKDEGISGGRFHFRNEFLTCREILINEFELAALKFVSRSSK
jgi:hypothetical protein